jgi:divalent metal cation (Fe/Co/Zn/Cd) transporter
MTLLTWAKRRVGRQLGNAVVMTDATQIAFCSYLSAVLLVGLGLNALLGWWWADPIAGLGIAALAVREGRDAWRGDSCCEAC